MPVYAMAGVKVEMDPRLPLLRDRAEKYLSGGEPDFRIGPPPKRSRLSRLHPPWRKGMSDESYEYAYYEGMFYRKLLKYDGFMFHSSALCYKGGAYMFSAPSGTGKSTHTAMWMNILGGDAVMINDDKPALRFVDGECRAYGTPFSGNSPVNATVSAPARGICFLEQAPENEIRRITPGEAFPLFYEETIRLLTKADAGILLRLFTRVAGSVPLFKLRCLPDRAAALLSIKTMTGADL